MGDSHENAIAALMDLWARAPRDGMFEGLNYVSQVRRIAERAGLEVEETPSLEDLACRLIGGRDGQFAAAERLRAETRLEAPWLFGTCPAPRDSDVVSLQGLRDRLAQALEYREFDDRRTLIATLSLDFELFPCLDARDKPSVGSKRDDLAARIAAVLIPAAIVLLSGGQLGRVRRCAALGCGTPFVDRSRDGRGQFCSTRCSARQRARRRRERELGRGT